MERKIALIVILACVFTPMALFAQNRITPAELSAWISSTPFTWADNGNNLGTITFTADGQGRASWSGDTHFWKVEPNGDLIVSAMGKQYVTRLVYNPLVGTFSGTRDSSSNVQDGVRAVLTPKAPFEYFQSKTGIGIIDRLRAWLIEGRFTWADNGNDLGTIVFAPDGTGKASWSGETHYWKLEANGDLVVSAMGTTYVTRLNFDFNTGNFSGKRDPKSQVQDGVKVVLKVVR